MGSIGGTELVMSVLMGGFPRNVNTLNNGRICFKVNITLNSGRTTSIVDRGGFEDDDFSPVRPRPSVCV